MNGDASSETVIRPNKQQQEQDAILIVIPPMRMTEGVFKSGFNDCPTLR
jgi:hypothetical protein